MWLISCTPWTLTWIAEQIGTVALCASAIFAVSAIVVTRRNER